MKLHVILQDYENYGEPALFGYPGGAIWKPKGMTEIFVVGLRVDQYGSAYTMQDQLEDFLVGAHIMINHQLFYQTILDVEIVDDHFETDEHNAALKEFGIACNTPTYQWN